MIWKLIWVIFLFFAIITASIGTFFLKKGAKKFSFSLRGINGHLIIGLGLFFSSSLFYIMALRYEKLSVINPLSSLSYIFVFVISAVFLKEKFNYLKALGLILIIIGCFMIVG